MRQFLIIGFTSSLIVGSYLAQDHLALLIGFAPLIGLLVLIAVLAFLYSILLCSVERMLDGEEKPKVPEPHRKSKWHHVKYSLSFLPAGDLSLKEHSPPTVLLPQE